MYLCESRYNEDRCRFAKIKTWSSCVPDEMRDQDYEMDLFEQPLRLKKVPGPIKHLLQPDAKESDPLPKPTWGKPNAPPIVGAVHRRPRESNVSRLSLLLLNHSIKSSTCAFVFAVRAGSSDGKRRWYSCAQAL